jgi:hypothetical protein
MGITKKIETTCLFTGMAEVKRTTKIKRDIMILAILLLPNYAKYNGKKDIFIAKVTSFFRLGLC